MTPSVSATRLGDSKKISVAGTAASSASRVLRWPSFDRQEAGKQERIGRQARRRQRSQHRRRPRNGHDPDPGSLRLLDQPEARIGNQRRAGVRHQRHAPSLLQRCDQLRPGLGRVVLVICDRPLPDAVAVEQHSRHARVLAGEHVRPRKRLQRAQRDVAEIADRRRHQIERGVRAAAPRSPPVRRHRFLADVPSPH